MENFKRSIVTFFPQEILSDRYQIRKIQKISIIILINFSGILIKAACHSDFFLTFLGKKIPCGIFKQKTVQSLSGMSSYHIRIKNTLEFTFK